MIDKTVYNCRESRLQRVSASAIPAKPRATKPGMEWPIVNLDILPRRRWPWQSGSETGEHGRSRALLRQRAILIVADGSIPFRM